MLKFLLVTCKRDFWWVKSKLIRLKRLNLVAPFFFHIYHLALKQVLKVKFFSLCGSGMKRLHVFISGFSLFYENDVSVLTKLLLIGKVEMLLLLTS